MSTHHITSLYSEYDLIELCTFTDEKRMQFISTSCEVQRADYLLNNLSRIRTRCCSRCHSPSHCCCRSPSRPSYRSLILKSYRKNCCLSNRRSHWCVSFCLVSCNCHCCRIPVPEISGSSLVPACSKDAPISCACPYTRNSSARIPSISGNGSLVERPPPTQLVFSFAPDACYKFPESWWNFPVNGSKIICR